MDAGAVNASGSFSSTGSTSSSSSSVSQSEVRGEKGLGCSEIRGAVTFWMVPGYLRGIPIPLAFAWGDVGVSEFGVGGDENLLHGSDACVEFLGRADFPCGVVAIEVGVEKVGCEIIR